MSRAAAVFVVPGSIQRQQLEAGPAAHEVEKTVVHDAVNPAVKAGAGFEPIKRGVSLDQALLEEILRIIGVSAQSIRHRVEAVLMLAQERLKLLPAGGFARVHRFTPESAGRQSASRCRSSLMVNGL